MTSNWQPIYLAAYKISNSLQQDNDEEILHNLQGGQITLTPKVISHMKRLEENSEINSPIFFTSQGSETNIVDPEDPPEHDIDDIDQIDEREVTTNDPTRYYLEQASLREEQHVVKHLPVQLIKALDKRVNDGMLVILVSEDEDDIVSRRLMLWYLPLSEGGFKLFQEDNKFKIDLVPELYLDFGKKFKAAMFEGNIGGTLSGGKVSDNSVSGSRYWIEDFLGASFELDTPQIQKKLAASLKKIAKPTVDTKEFNQRNEDGLNMVEDEGELVFDFGGALDRIENMDDEEELTIDLLVEQFVPEPKKATFNRSFPEEIRSVPFQAKSTKETFQEQFRRKKIRAILSDDSVIEIIGSREIIEKHLKRNVSNGKVTFTLEARDTIEDLMR